MEDFGNIEIGNIFRLDTKSKVLYEKISEEEGKILDDTLTYGIKLSKDHKVKVVHNT